MVVVEVAIDQVKNVGAVMEDDEQVDRVVNNMAVERRRKVRND